MKIRNRALTQDRPTKINQLKKVDITNKNHSCNPANRGHDYRFLIKDNYGCCSKCGDEVLT